MSSVSKIGAVLGISCAVIPLGGILVATLIASVIKSINIAGKEKIQIKSKNSSTSSKNKIKSISTLRKEIKNKKRKDKKNITDNKLSDLEKIKLSTLQRISTTPYFIEQPLEITKSLEKFLTTTTAIEAQNEKLNLLHNIEKDHQKIFIKGITHACTNASIQVGFKSVKTTLGPTGIVRVIALNKKGRALVSEINADFNSDPSVETEVVGIDDNSCIRILDDFDKALSNAGIHASTPMRKFTGGVCELQSAKEFVQKKVKHKKIQGTLEKIINNSVGLRRSQRLNQNQKIYQKQK